MFDFSQPLFIIRATAGRVGFPMGLEARDASVAFTARVTNVRFFAMMNMSVEFHVDSLSVIAAAGRTAIGLFSSMKPEMGLEVRRGAKPFAANLALVGLFSYKEIEN